MEWPGRGSISSSGILFNWQPSGRYRFDLIFGRWGALELRVWNIYTRTPCARSGRVRPFDITNSLLIILDGGKILLKRGRGGCLFISGAARAVFNFNFTSMNFREGRISVF